jgi:hypothetical protein
MLPATPVKAAKSILLLVGTLLPTFAAAQNPSPPPSTPERVFQDELDLQANANFVQGSGARAYGMGGAFLARADDATAASWNPAGLSYLRAPELSFVYLDSSFKGRKTVDGRAIGPTGTERTYVQHTRDDRSSGFPDFMAFTWPWEIGEFGGAIQVSYQRLIPFASERTIADRTHFIETNEETLNTRSVKSNGGFDVLALGSGVRLSRKLRVGATLNRWFNGYQQTTLKPEQTVPSRQFADFDLSGWNFHLGAMFSPVESLNLGLVYKTPFTASSALSRVRYDSFPATPATPARDNFNTFANPDVEVDIPKAIGVGVSWRPRSALTISMDYTRSSWSAARIRGFFALPRADINSPVDRPTPDPLGTRDFCGVYPADRPPPSNPCPPELPYPTLDASVEQADSEQLRTGIEWVVIKRGIKWPLRIGMFRDTQFFRSLEGDPPTFTGFTAGTGIVLNQVLLDVAYVYETGTYTDRNIVFQTLDQAQIEAGVTPEVLRYPGDNDVKSHKIYASVIYRFSRR